MPKPTRQWGGRRYPGLDGAHRLEVFLTAQSELAHSSDAIQPNEIPKSLSFHSWMRNEAEALAFLKENHLP